MTTRKTSSRKRTVKTAAQVSDGNTVHSGMLTVAEFRRYIDAPCSPLEGVFYLSRLAAKGANIVDTWPAEDVGGYAFQLSSERLDILQEKLESQFKEKYSKRTLDLEAEQTISISKEDVEEFRSAFAPVCSFTNLVGCQDMEHEVAMYQSWIGSIIRSIATEGLSLMEERLAAAEGGLR